MYADLPKDVTLQVFKKVIKTFGNSTLMNNERFHSIDLPFCPAFAILPTPCSS